MLKISEMAKLANTTRRTLIFYDQEGLFSPTEKNETGYRYYDYTQLYDLLFILGLRKLGLPIDEIKKVQKQPDYLAADSLLKLQDDINTQMSNLTYIQTIIDKKLAQPVETSEQPLLAPYIAQQPAVSFWCSEYSVECTEEEVAELFAKFYQQLDQLAVMDIAKSGFLTYLPDANPTDYETASFRVIKEYTTNSKQVIMPIVEKPAGHYACIKVENTLPGIQSGLAKLQAFCKAQNLTITDDLWQINTSDKLITTGSSKYGIFQYLILN